MEGFQTLVRNLVVILLIASFLELLLPNKSLRGYVQLVMGLFVISALLNPIAAWLKMPLEMEIPAWITTQSADMPALAQDGQAENLGGDAVQKQYREILINQIEALALAVKGVKGADAVVEFDKQAGKITDQPQIRKVRIEISLSADENKIEPVKPVEINGADNQTSQAEKQTDSAAGSALAQEVREKVASFMNLSPDVVEVTEKK